MSKRGYIGLFFILVGLWSFYDHFFVPHAEKVEDLLKAAHELELPGGDPGAVEREFDRVTRTSGEAIWVGLFFGVVGGLLVASGVKKKQGPPPPAHVGNTHVRGGDAFQGVANRPPRAAVAPDGAGSRLTEDGTSTPQSSEVSPAPRAAQAPTAPPPHNLPETVLQQVGAVIGGNPSQHVVYEFKDIIARGRHKIVALTAKSIWLCVFGKSPRYGGLELLSKKEVPLQNISTLFQERKNTLFSGTRSTITIKWGGLFDCCALESGLEQGDYFYVKLKELMAAIPSAKEEDSRTQSKVETVGFEEKLRALAKLRDDGVLTEEEFKEKKQEILHKEM